MQIFNVKNGCSVENINRNVLKKTYNSIKMPKLRKTIAICRILGYYIKY